MIINIVNIAITIYEIQVYFEFDLTLKPQYESECKFIKLAYHKTLTCTTAYFMKFTM